MDLAHLVHARGSVSVGEIPRVAIDMVGFGGVFELDGFDFLLAFQECSGDTMHSVHHPAIRGKDDGEGGVYFLDEPHVIDDLSARGALNIAIEPIHFVHFPDR